MARPPLPIGTYGKIHVSKLDEGRFRARTKFRDYDGITRVVERVGKSKAAAENNLKEALRDRSRVSATGEITTETLVSTLGEQWLTEMDKAAAEGKRSANTAEQYRYHFVRHIEKGVGRLRIREASVSRLDRLVATVKELH